MIALATTFPRMDQISPFHSMPLSLVWRDSHLSSLSAFLTSAPHISG